MHQSQSMAEVPCVLMTYCHDSNNLAGSPAHIKAVNTPGRMSRQQFSATLSGSQCWRRAIIGFHVRVEYAR